MAERDAHPPVIHIIRARLRPRNGPLPPPPPGVRHVEVPFIGIFIADHTLRRRIDRFFHWPMIVLALLILPLLLVDVLYLHRSDAAGDVQHRWLYWIVTIGVGVIWVAFLIEFIIKIAIAECRFEYVRRNWLDLIIIAVPFLRPLRIASLAKTSRLFALRGVGMKFARYAITIIVGMEMTERLLTRLGLRSDGRPDPDTMTRYQLTQEVKRLRRAHDAWIAWYAQHRKYLAAHQPAVDDDPLPEAVVHEIEQAEPGDDAATLKDGDVEVGNDRDGSVEGRETDEPAPADTPEVPKRESLA